MARRVVVGLSLDIVLCALVWAVGTYCMSGPSRIPRADVHLRSFLVSLVEFPTLAVLLCWSHEVALPRLVWPRPRAARAPLVAGRGFLASLLSVAIGIGAGLLTGAVCTAILALCASMMLRGSAFDGVASCCLILYLVHHSHDFPA